MKRYQPCIALAFSCLLRAGRAPAQDKAPWCETPRYLLLMGTSAEAFDAMYHSNQYQQHILPLRKDSARYRLMTFEPAQ
jgi:hypothetical protein